MRWILHWGLALLFWAAPLAGDQFILKSIGQTSACVEETNVLSATLSVDLALRNAAADQFASTVRVSDLVETTTFNGNLNIADHAMAFSGIASVGEYASAGDSSIFVDNALRAGFQRNHTIRIDDELVRIVDVLGPGCNESHIVHMGCWNTLLVLRAQHGSTAASHFRGALAYRVYAAALMDAITLTDGGEGLNNAQQFVNVDTLEGFEGQPSIFEQRYCRIGDEVLSIELVINETDTVFAVGTTFLVLPDTFSTENNFYAGVDIVIVDGPGVGQRRKIDSYIGNQRVASFTDFWEETPQAGISKFRMMALKVARGQKGTGTLQVLGSAPNIIIIQLGQIHRQGAQVYFTNDTWAPFSRTGQWTQNDGVVEIPVIADTDPFQRLEVSIPLRNPSNAQTPVTVSAEVLGVTIPRDQLQTDSRADAWPIYLPLLVCGKGTFMSAGQVVCTDCGVGKFSEACGGFNCTSCPAATYTSEAAQTACLDCEPGFFCVGDSDRQLCQAGTFSEASASSCSECPVGYFCLAGLPRQECAEGSFMNRTGATACYACPPGEFADAPAATACSLCLPGTISSWSATACDGCTPGTFNVGLGQTSCQDCGDDTYQPDVGTTACLQCPLNTGARWVMGECSGACGGSSSKDDCLCAPGFTRFGQTGDECVAFEFTIGEIGQSTACRGRLNTIGVTIGVNEPLTTAVQEIRTLRSGHNYKAGTLQVREDGSFGFAGSFKVDDAGAVTSVVIEDSGTGFLGQPEAVEIYFADDCATDASQCTTTLQNSTIAVIPILAAGSGYVSGVLDVSGGGGSGCEASFSVDQDGGLSQIIFATASAHGTGYSTDPMVQIMYRELTRCDDGVSDLGNRKCVQDGTITQLVVQVNSAVRDCDTSVMIYATGGGGSGFLASIADINALGGIRAMTIINHGSGYMSDPLFNVSSPTCTCNGVPGTVAGSFNDCIGFFRAQGAQLQASPAAGADLQAITGSKVIVQGLTGGAAPDWTEGGTLTVQTEGMPSLTAGQTQTCGVLTDGTGLCWGTSESVNTEPEEVQATGQNVQTWTCGFPARYFRFVPLRVRGGDGAVQIAEIELYARGEAEPLVVLEATNPGGSNPPGLLAGQVIDKFPETKWNDGLARPLILDMGSPVVVESYRWMTATDASAADPLEWRLEATNHLDREDRWVVIHERTRDRHGAWSVPGTTSAENITSYPRSTWTRLFHGQCSLPLGQTWRALSLSSSHGCGVSSSGAGLCWGHNSWGQLQFPGQSCSCPHTYGVYCECTSANFDSVVYQKVRIEGPPTQCPGETCYNTYGDGTCNSNGCDYIYTKEECVRAGIAMGFVDEADPPTLFPQQVPVFPKGCYWMTDVNRVSRLHFNANNQTDFCDTELNCLCRNCRPYSFIFYASQKYCGGTFEANGAELVGAKDVESCQAACGADEECDFFTFYPETTSVSCAPCCFRRVGDCQLIDPSRIPPQGVGSSGANALWTSVSAGHLHSCGIDMSGSLQCWGFDGDGQSTVPASLAHRRWVMISAGRHHTCGILDDLTIQCWGAQMESGFNVGQIVPVAGKGTLKWKTVSAGVWQTCAVTETGEMYCWGCGGQDKLGRPIGLDPYGSNVDKGQCAVPEGGHKWVSVASAEFHSCGVTDKGEGFCWGCRCNPSGCPAYNSPAVDYGQCAVPAGYEWSSISVAKYHSCGLTVQGEVKCWGCIVDETRPYLSINGQNISQIEGSSRARDLGQCNPPTGIQTWMNPAAFQTKGDFRDGKLTLTVQSDTIVGADYFFSVPLINPSEIRQPVTTAATTVGVPVQRLELTNAPGVRAPFRVVACEPATMYNESTGACDLCTPGSYSLECGVSSCTPCPPGQYSFIGETGCTECGIATFTQLYGTTVCSPCPDGTHGTVVGAQSAYDGCVECQPGTFSRTRQDLNVHIGAWMDVGASSCTLCPRGYFCEGGRDKQRCPDGTWQDQTGAVHEEQCTICAYTERCSGLWPRVRCESGNEGKENGFEFTEMDTCLAECLTVNAQPGQCVAIGADDNGCLTGYQGSLCSACQENFAPDHLDDQCKECPGVWYQALAVILHTGMVLFVPFICELGIVSWKVAVYYRILLTFFQSQDLTLAVTIRWPDWLFTYIKWLRILDLDTALASPQCFTLGKRIDTYREQYFFELFFPCWVAGLLTGTALVFHFLSGISSLGAKGVARNLHRAAWSTWRLLGNWLTWCVVPILGTLFRSLHCTCVPPGYELHRPSWNNCSWPGAREVVTSSPYVECMGEEHSGPARISAIILVCMFAIVPFVLVLLPDVKKRAVSRNGKLVATHIGVERGVQIGLGVSDGTGLLIRLQRKIAEVENLSRIAQDDLSRLQVLEEDGRAKGLKRDVQAAIDEQEANRLAVITLEERLVVLQSARERAIHALHSSSDSGGALAMQQDAMHHARSCLGKNILNFVELLQEQETRYKSTEGYLDRAMKARRETWLFRSPIVAYWRRTRRKVDKASKSLDVYRERALVYAFWASTGLLVPFAAVGTFVLWIRYQFQRWSIAWHNDFIAFDLEWAQYGAKDEVVGQTFRVNPVFAQYAPLDEENTVEGKIAIVFRGRGDQHESTAIKVRRLQAAGAIAAVVVNETNSTFAPAIKTENFASFQAINIPVVGIASSAVHQIADGSIVSFRFRHTLPALFGLSRIRAIATLPIFLPLIENYWEQRKWFEVIVLARKVSLSVLRVWPAWYPQIQSSCILGATFCYMVMAMQRPFGNDSFNKMEVTSAVASFFSALVVTMTTSIFGVTSNGIPGLEGKGTAGDDEDWARERLFRGLAFAVLANLILAGIFLVYQPVKAAVLATLLRIKRWLTPKPVEVKEPEQPPEPERPPVADEFVSALHAMAELQRVLPYSSVCQCAQQAVLGGLRAQQEVLERKKYLEREALRRRPWKVALGKGLGGYFAGKDVMTFRHGVTGEVVEVPGNSSGEVRFRVPSAISIRSCMSDGIMVHREAFFAPQILKQLAEGADSVQDANSAPQWVGRWEIAWYPPNVCVRHMEKAVEVWLLRQGFVILGNEHKAVLAMQGVDAEIVPREKGEEAVARSMVSYSSALSAIAGAKAARLFRRKKPKHQQMGVGKPRSALEAITQGLDAFPGEVPLTLEGRIHSAFDAPSVPEAPPKPDPHVRRGSTGGEHNSAVIAWKRPGGDTRAPPKLSDIKLEPAESTAPSPGAGVSGRAYRPEAGVGSSRRLLAPAGSSRNLVRTGSWLEPRGLVQGLEDMDSQVRHRCLRHLIRQVPKGDEEVRDMLLQTIQHGSSAVRVDGVRAMQALSRKHDEVVVRALQALMVEDVDAAVREGASQALLVVDPD